MSDWTTLTLTLAAAVSEDTFWSGYLSRLTAGSEPSFAVHLGVFVEPFLQYLLDGRKTIESRFSMRRFPPYNCVAPGDVVLVKRAGGPIVGLCHVSDIWFYRLDPASWSTIRSEFAAALCAQDPSFWERRSGASFASLMRVDRVRVIEPIVYPKRDRRGWVVLGPKPVSQPSLAL